MSKFNNYARKVDEIARAAFAEYRKAEQNLATAEENAREYPQMYGVVQHDGYAIKSAHAQADYLEAKKAMEVAKKVFESHKSEIAALRKELVSELDEYYAADPAALDGNTLELLKSGILSANEYAKLMSKAQENGNYTMARMIGKYADDAAAQRISKYGQDDEQAIVLRGVSYASVNEHNGSETLQAYDLLSEVYSRSVDNPAMIESWDELTSAVVESM